MFRKKRELITEKPVVTEVKLDKNEGIISHLSTFLSGRMKLSLTLDDNSKLGTLINQTIRQFHDSIKQIISHIVSVSTTAFQLEVSVKRLDDSIHVQRKQINNISSQTTTLGSDINSIAVKTEKLNSDAKKVIDTTHSGINQVEAFTTDLNEVDSKITETQSYMVKLKESADSIHTLTELIDDISSKLDIISINTSIEAARAGAAGKGFEVLAKEIRKLSGESQNTVNRVHNIINEVLTNTESVESALKLSRERVNICMDQSRRVVNDFDNINRLNNSLGHETSEISQLLQSQNQSAQHIQNSTKHLLDQGDQIISQMKTTREMSRELHETVDNVLESAHFELDWHDRALKALLSLCKKLSYGGDLNRTLEESFSIHPYIELLYVMSEDGKQITPNIVNPDYSDIISFDGLGEDRSNRPYVSTLSSAKHYLSGIYVSTASKDLCVTVSTKNTLSSGESVIVAADINIKDFIKLD